MADYVCRHCLKPGPFSELVDLEGWRGIDNIHPDRDDEDKLVFEESYEKDAEWHTADRTGFLCSSCQRSAGALHELVIEKPVYECRSCGWRGGDPADHPASCAEPSAELLEAVQQPDEQEKLDIPG